MAGTYDKITEAVFTPERCGLHWVEFQVQDQETHDWQTNWLLVEQATDRVLASIDGPSPKQICYAVAVEGHGGGRFYISLDGAKRNAIAVAMKILKDENRDSSERRKARHETRKTRGKTA